MSNENQSGGVKTKNITLKSVIAWIFGAVVGLVGIVCLFSSPFLGIALILSAAIVFPPTYNFIKDKMHVALSTGLKITIVVILVIVGGAITSKINPTIAPAVATPVSVPAPDESASQPQTAPQVQAVSKPAVPTPVVATPAPVVAPAPQVLLNVSGSGTKSTQSFTAGGDWTLNYSYDCSNFDDRGNFQVYIYNSDGSMSDENTGVNELGAGGTDTEYYHSGGSYYLEVNSECTWKITVKG
jgi:hypothetical protein